MDLIFLFELKKLTSQAAGRPDAAGSQGKKSVSETQPEPFVVVFFFFLLALVGWLYFFQCRLAFSIWQKTQSPTMPDLCLGFSSHSGLKAVLGPKI